jgi:hypothetical protein
MLEQLLIMMKTLNYAYHRMAETTPIFKPQSLIEVIRMADHLEATALQQAKDSKGFKRFMETDWYRNRDIC